VRVLWLTPVHSRSAIGRFSDLVVARLVALGCHVAVGATETSFDPADQHPFGGLPVTSAAHHLAAGEAFDVIVANFGDHYPNHELALDALAFPLLIGIFHDADMSNFANGMRAAGREPIGENGDWPVGRNVTAAIAKRCGGAVVHSRFYLPAAESCDGPIAAIPLAWAPPQLNREPRPASQPLASEFRLVTFGNVNQNKCPNRVIEAIGGSPVLREAVEYRLVGAAEPAMETSLREFAERFGVKLAMVGRVDDAELLDELAQATVVSCLREPVLEGSSASAIEAMMQGCLVVVSDAGFYADLPDDCVVKVPPETDVSSIRAALESICAAPEASAALRRRARNYSLATFSPAKYGDALLRLAQDVRMAGSYVPLVDRVARDLAGLGISPGAEAADLVLRSIEAMAPVERRGMPSRAEAGELTSFCQPAGGNAA
jgi:glycosyltransferase involved in cell wall biosynthesis